MNNETIRILLGYAFAFFLVAACLWFLFKAFLDPTVASLPQDQQTVFVAGMFGLINLAAGFVFQQVASSSATRAAERSAAQGANAALATPPGPAGPAAPDPVTDNAVATQPKTDPPNPAI